MYVYCGNNWINLYDTTGESATLVIGGISLLAVGILATVSTIIVLDMPAVDSTYDEIFSNRGIGIEKAKLAEQLAMITTMKLVLESPVSDSIQYAKEHTKNKRKSTWDKHTKRRSGRMNTKNRSKPNWVQKGTKKIKGIVITNVDSLWTLRRESIFGNSLERTFYGGSIMKKGEKQ